MQIGLASLGLSPYIWAWEAFAAWTLAHLPQQGLFSPTAKTSSSHLEQIEYPLSTFLDVAGMANLPGLEMTVFFPPVPLPKVLKMCHAFNKVI